MKLSSATALASFAIHGALATTKAGGSDYNDTGSTNGFISVTQTQVPARNVRSEPLAEPLSSLKPDEMDERNTTVASTGQPRHFARYTEPRAEHSSSIRQEDVLQEIHAKAQAEPTSTTNTTTEPEENKRDVQAIRTLFITPTPSTLTITPTPSDSDSDSTLTYTLPATTQNITITPTATPTTATPTPKKFYKQQQLLTETCQPDYVERCRLLPNTAWWPAGGKECFCILESHAPPLPQVPQGDEGLWKNFIKIRHVPLPVQATILPDGRREGTPEKAWWIWAHREKSWWEEEQGGGS